MMSLCNLTIRGVIRDGKNKIALAHMLNLRNNTPITKLDDGVGQINAIGSKYAFRVARGHLTRIESVIQVFNEIAISRIFTQFKPVRNGNSFAGPDRRQARSEEHTSELQSLMRISYA